jgi:hypothetical protein
MVDLSLRKGLSHLTKSSNHHLHPWWYPQLLRIKLRIWYKLIIKINLWIRISIRNMESLIIIKILMIWTLHPLFRPNMRATLYPLRKIKYCTALRNNSQTYSDIRKKALKVITMVLWINHWMIAFKSWIHRSHCKPTMTAYHIARAVTLSIH